MRSASSPNDGALGAALSGERLYEDVLAYCELGFHRTGSAGDRKTSNWLARELARAGLSVRFHAFEVGQFLLKRSRLAVGGRDIECIPLWLPKATGPRPVEAPIARWPEQNIGGRIGLLSLPATGARAMPPPQAEIVQIVAAACAAAPAALLVVTEGPTGELVAINSARDPSTWPVPALIVGPRDRPALEMAAQQGASATVSIEGDAAVVTSRNVIADLPATAPAGEFRDVIVVSTPISAWFRSGGERGPGVATFLGLARWAAARERACDWMFIGTSAHELGYAGIDSLLRDQPPPRERVRCWLLLGAGIAAREWDQAPDGLRRLERADPNRQLYCSADLEAVVRDAFAKVGFVGPLTDRAGGEQTFLLERNYRRLGMALDHRYHHCRSDGPEMTAPALLQPIAHAWARTLAAVEAG